MRRALCRSVCVNTLFTHGLGQDWAGLVQKDRQGQGIAPVRGLPIPGPYGWTMFTSQASERVTAVPEADTMSMLLITS